MNESQWIIVAVSVVSVIGLFAMVLWPRKQPEVVQEPPMLVSRYQVNEALEYLGFNPERIWNSPK